MNAREEQAPSSREILERSRLMRLRSVQTWLQSLGITEDQAGEKLNVLAAFCQSLGETPDQILQNIISPRTGKVRLKVRDAYLEKLQAFQDSLSGSPWQKVAQGNVIRSFFIHNGLRLAIPVSPWMAPDTKD